MNYFSPLNKCFDYYFMPFPPGTYQHFPGIYEKVIPYNKQSYEQHWDSRSNWKDHDTIFKASTAFYT